MDSPLRKLVALDIQEVRDLVRAQLALLRARRRVAREPIGALAIRAPLDASEVRGDAGRAHAIARAVIRASRFGIFRPYCLVQSLALRDLLRAERIEGASIRVGVRRHRGEFQAHAWVRWGDLVLGDVESHVARFTEVEDLRVLDRR